MHKTGIDLTEILDKEVKEQRHSFLLPVTVQECNTELRTAKREVAKIIEISFEVQDNERSQQIKELQGRSQSK
jgi:hypothetical protein